MFFFFFTQRILAPAASEGTVQYQKNLYKFDIHCSWHPVIIPTIHLIPSQQLEMSSSESSTIPMRRKRTISERVTDNGDPLVVRKKAGEAAEQAKKITQVFFL